MIEMHKVIARIVYMVVSDTCGIRAHAGRPHQQQADALATRPKCPCVSIAYTSSDSWAYVHHFEAVCLVYCPVHCAAASSPTKSNDKASTQEVTFCLCVGFIVSTNYFMGCSVGSSTVGGIGKWKSVTAADSITSNINSSSVTASPATSPDTRRSRLNA